MISKPRTVLIIEDEDALRSVLGDAFRAEGFGVIEAKDGGRGSLKPSFPSRILFCLIFLCRGWMAG